MWQEMKCVIWEKCWGATGLFSPQSLHCGAISIQCYTAGLAKEQRAGGEEDRRAGRWSGQERGKKNEKGGDRRGTKKIREEGEMED